ncbi:ABC transporter substrate-binding protein [Pseudomonas typographi]|uniref:ABC transporter substrate-binding protein n=1 Tax=Pseudomonas typographi TaxID=2715964 RepID=A0ABR7YYD3_9PSED|nr:ABC transporter substrate-binding protein [Pseudomonas typographi]MBD1550748.1 ABC transporter substrate-binding protein [Pseudomonas typographi]MBD1587690.1 ABC transporter substrate-binding protein [Pseudomonas typographi]MBD1598213.1 ABC transporter substrate-binding protein [Pseudomonas typographi]
MTSFNKAVHSATRRWFIKGSVAAASLYAFGATRQGQAASDPAAAIRITLPSKGSAGYVWQTVIEKYLDPAYSEGLKLEWVVADPGKMQVQLAAGSLDVGVFGAVGLATLNNKGYDISLFGPALNNHGRWLVKGDSPYQSPQDLKGKRLASQPETTETYQQARIASSLNGLDLKKDFQVIFGPPTANLALFDRGDVDGVIVLEPTATRMVANGAREIARVGDLWKHATGTQEDPFLVGLAAQRKWLAANREVASRLASLFAAANQLLHDRPEVLKDIHQAFGLGDTETAAIALLPQRLPSAYATRWDESVWRQIDKELEVAVSVGVLDKKPDQPIYDGVPLKVRNA